MGDLARSQVPEPVAIVTIDVSYLSLAAAIPQLDAIDLARGCDLIALVKPMFELALPTAPTDDVSLEEAIARASTASIDAGWHVVATMRSPVTGAKGAVEGLIHANWPGIPAPSAEIPGQNDQPVASSVGSLDGSVTTSATAASP